MKKYIITTLFAVAAIVAFHHHFNSNGWYFIISMIGVLFLSCMFLIGIACLDEDNPYKY